MRPRGTWIPMAVLALAAVACSGTPPTVTPSAPTEDVGATQTASAQAEPLTIEVLNDEVAVGFERVAFRILDAGGAPISAAADVQGTFNRVSQLSADQQMAQKVSSGTAFYFGEDLPSGGSWVVYSDFDASGPWWWDIVATRGDWRGQGRADVEVVAQSAAPRAGDRPPEANTPTLGPETDIAAITSDPEPLEALYETSLADAVAERTGAVVLFASPAHCDTPACAATLEELKQVQRTIGSQTTFIHVESRDLDNPDELSATARAWGLEDEPWTFVINKRGYIGARVKGELGATELQLLVETIMQQ